MCKTMHLFDRDIHLASGPDSAVTAHVSDCWSINNTPNGGYIMALMARALGNGCEEMTACVITVNYLSRCDFALAEIRVEDLTESRNFIRRQARLIQNNTERIRAWATFVKSSDSGSSRQKKHNSQEISSYETGPDDLLPPDKCIPVGFMPGYSLFDNIDLRLDPSCAGWMKGRLAQRSIQKGWVRFKNFRSADLAAIALFCDSFPPCVFASHGAVAWVPTLEYSVNLRSLPKTPWLQGIFKTRFMSAGLVEEDGELWDEQGILVAVSRQIAKYPGR